MLQPPSNSARNLHGNSAASAGLGAAPLPGRGANRGRPPPARPRHPCRGRPAPAGPAPVPAARGETRGRHGALGRRAGGRSGSARGRPAGAERGAAQPRARRPLLRRDGAQQRLRAPVERTRLTAQGSRPRKARSQSSSSPQKRPGQVLDAQGTQAGRPPSPVRLGFARAVFVGEGLLRGLCQGSRQPQLNSAACSGGTGGGSAVRRLRAHRIGLSVSAATACGRLRMPA